MKRGRSPSVESVSSGSAAPTTTTTATTTQSSLAPSVTSGRHLAPCALFPAVPLRLPGCGPIVNVWQKTDIASMGGSPFVLPPPRGTPVHCCGPTSLCPDDCIFRPLPSSLCKQFFLVGGCGFAQTGGCHKVHIALDVNLDPHIFFDKRKKLSASSWRQLKEGAASRATATARIAAREVETNKKKITLEAGRQTVDVLKNLQTVGLNISQSLATLETLGKY